MTENLGRRTRKIVFAECITFCVSFLMMPNTPGLLLFCYFMAVVVNLVLIILHFIHKPKMFYAHIILLMAVIIIPIFIAINSLGRMC